MEIATYSDFLLLGAWPCPHNPPSCTMQLFNLGLQKSRFSNNGTVLEANLRPASTGLQIRLPDTGVAFEAEVTVRHTAKKHKSF